MPSDMPSNDGFPLLPKLTVDLTSRFRCYELLSQLCWPDPHIRALRVPTIGALEIATAKQDFAQNVFRVMSDMALEIDIEIGHVKAIVEQLSDGTQSAELILEFLSTLAADGSSGDVAINEGLHRFIVLVRSKKLRPNEALASTIREIRAEFIEPYGDDLALAASESADAVGREISERMEGAAFRSGLLLCTVARLAEHEMKNLQTINRSNYIISSVKGSKFNSKTTMAMWSRWKTMSPVWAGLITASNYRTSEDDLLSTIFVKGGVERTFSHAKWFVDFATRHRSTHSKAADVLIDPSLVIAIDIPVDSVKPPLPPLSAAERAACFKYRA